VYKNNAFYGIQIGKLDITDWKIADWKFKV
jgi:hypothetical protein